MNGILDTLSKTGTEVIYIGVFSLPWHSYTHKHSVYMYSRVVLESILPSVNGVEI